MNMLKLVYAVSLLLFAAASTPQMHACAKPPGFGFDLRTQFVDLSLPNPVAMNQANQTVSGAFHSPANNTTAGDQTSFQGTSNGSSVLSERGKATPATWDITFLTGRCSVADPFSFGIHTRTILFLPDDRPQAAICDENANGVGFAANPSSVDTSTQQYSWTITMTSQGGPWNYTPASYVNFDAQGNILAQGPVTVTDSYDCYATWIVSYTGGPQYIWMAESSGMGIGYTSFAVTNGTGGGGM
jgi:hypothetical protein